MITDKMQKCPLCKTEYNDMAQVCPLKHCSNCGSLKLKSHKKRSFQTNRAKQNFIFILPSLGFFVLVYGFLLAQGSLIPFLSIVAVYSVAFIAILFKFTTKNIDCEECHAKNFPYACDINLNPIKINGQSIDDKDLSKKIAKTVLDGLAKEQKKHNRRDILVRAAGAISIAIIALLGTFFVNPDDVLIGEIIEIIKSFQEPN